MRRINYNLFLVEKEEEIEHIFIGLKNTFLLELIENKVSNQACQIYIAHINAKHKIKAGALKHKTGLMHIEIGFLPFSGENPIDCLFYHIEIYTKEDLFPTNGEKQ